MKIMFIIICLMSFNSLAFAADEMVQAQCWMDDDLDFDFDQFSGGILYALSTFEIRQECMEMSESKFKDQATSRVKDINIVSGNRVVAECWLDDDLDFDFDQFNGGEMTGESTREIRNACLQKAKQRFGDQGTADLKNVVPEISTTSFVKGDCWTNDDPDFDFDQFDEGPVIGKSQASLETECQWVAKKRFGDQGTSGVKNITDI